VWVTLKTTALKERSDHAMATLKEVAVLVLWIFISQRAVSQAWTLGIGLLFLPTAFAVDFPYQRFIRDRAK
jgi:hypothetical protein